MSAPLHIPAAVRAYAKFHGVQPEDYVQSVIDERARELATVLLKPRGRRARATPAPQAVNLNPARQ